MTGILFAVPIIGLAHPFRSLIVLAFVIGIGWILDGFVDVTAGASGSTRRPRWLAVVSGVISIIAGIVIFLLPELAITTFILFSAILLIVVSATTLLTRPFRRMSVATV